MDISERLFAGDDAVYVSLAEKYKATCENKQLVKDGGFWVEQSKYKGIYTFKAVLKVGDKPALSTAFGNPGQCNSVDTMKGSRQCGLATVLMRDCFEDEDVTKNGGWLDPQIWNDPVTNAVRYAFRLQLCYYYYC